MIAYIKGTLVKIDENAMIVDVNGVGYEIICPDPFVFQSSLYNDVSVSTYHYVREDAQILYGFRNEDEKVLFTNLISVSGIGPKGALSILGSVDAAGLIAAIEQEDDKFLTSLPGIGKKTARQIILDLKGKLSTVVSIPAGASEDLQAGETSEGLQEAQEALKSLGYTEREIKAVLPELRKESTSGTDETVRIALALLMKNK
ncbi:Holliday junction branch migration protein RuvA [Lentibacillus amyloliquefaciens]|uniref:Holliday junction branch migration complex subunit RuvA n=1 Tax=Lentibacillus amyloliquefaciens TaxID=1472767 RepID=A0A0U3WEI1_9BACI|nr:Holliday junction branch migration protein RuvA [Lentibacillus amyloliquefaciens]ALX48191.1 Holliday junction ATP-dependent DNA helicase RuvA [Lentibacillus amyloliquefaciens]